MELPGPHRRARLPRSSQPPASTGPAPGTRRAAPSHPAPQPSEQASLGNGLVELAYLSIGFPTCWCVTTVPQPLRSRAEAAYHTTWRALTGVGPRGELVDACTGWLIRGDALVERVHRGTTNHLACLPREDWRWGTATARQRLLHRLTVVTTMAHDHSHLTNVARLTRAMADHLQRRWPTLRPLPTTRNNTIPSS